MANKPEYLTSLHGRKFGIGPQGQLIVNDNESGKGVGAQALVEGVQITTITTAQLLALNATPQSIVPAPGAGKAVVLRFLAMTKPAGTAYAGVAAGEDLVAKYTDGSGEQVTGQIETTGFLDSSGQEHRYVFGKGAFGSVAQMEPALNAAIVLHLLSAEITTGTSDLIVLAKYDVIEFPIV